MELTSEEIAVLEKFSAGLVPWEIIEKIPFGKFVEEELPTALVLFGGTYLARTRIDGENVWAVISKYKGRFRYGAYADTLKALLAGL